MFLDIVSELSFDSSFNCLQGDFVKQAEDADRVQNIAALKGIFPLVGWVPTSFIQDVSSIRHNPMTPRHIPLHLPETA